MLSQPGIDDCRSCVLGNLSAACPFHATRRAEGTLLFEQGENGGTTVRVVLPPYTVIS